MGNSCLENYSSVDCNNSSPKLAAIKDIIRDRFVKLRIEQKYDKTNKILSASLSSNLK